MFRLDLKMTSDSKRQSRLMAVTILILTLSHRTTGGGSWRRLESLFVQDQHKGEQWDENRIIFPDMLDSVKTSWHSTTTARYDEGRQPCDAECRISKEYSPVCGTNGVTYQNMGQLECAIKCGVAVELQRATACSTFPTVTTTTTSPIATSRNEELEDCMRKCPSTPEYNPVCGTNYVTYFNAGKLRCARLCGVDVALLRRSPCPTHRTSTTTDTPTTKQDLDVKVKKCIFDCPATTEYYPVCGTNNVTYYNVGKLTCAKLCGVDVNVQSQGQCSIEPTEVLVENVEPATFEENYGEENIDARYLLG